MFGMASNTEKNYRVGIDVGTHSTGFCAIEVDDVGYPVGFLSCLTFVHDSGVDPGGRKTATTRRAASGVARRTRRRIRRRRQRLDRLDALLESMGFPLVDLEELADPRAPWHARARLASGRVSDEERNRLISIAVRHMARHRGWRSSYARVSTLLVPEDPSQLLIELRERVEESLGTKLAVDSTPGQVIAALLDHQETKKLRGPNGILQGKLFQSDNANELRTIAAQQGFDDHTVKRLIEAVFHSESPKGSARGTVGRDPLPGQRHLPRAEMAHPAFQEFRIASTLANLRIRDGEVVRPLSADELRAAFGLLTRSEFKEPPTWDEVAEHLGLSRGQLKGTAEPGPDGTPAPIRPPIDVTDVRMRECKVQAVRDWWSEADSERRGAFVDEVSNVGVDETDSEATLEVEALLASLEDRELDQLDNLNLPSGRAAYSVETLELLTKEILKEGVDLHTARKSVFGVADNWTPPVDLIGKPVGNPAVDRVLKQVSRWLDGCYRAWGSPQVVNIEHVRDALGSEKLAREYERELARRRHRNEELAKQMHESLGLSGPIRASDRTRYRTIVRQNGQCLYCGAPITFETAEMDHIVPRAGLGATNTWENLAAVCRTCNHQKANLPFVSWAESCDRPGVSLSEAKQRVRQWIRDPQLGTQENKRLKDGTRRRLESRDPDSEIDGRSLASTAWMANELASRVRAHFQALGSETSVDVYKGQVTAEARRATGFEGRINLEGGRGKTRFDRRHHAMDALVISLMEGSVAQTIALRRNLRDTQQLKRVPETWRSFTGSTPGASRTWKRWSDGMLIASELFNIALANDQIPILQNLRLRFGSSSAHEDTVKKFEKRKLGEVFSLRDIDRAATPALWTALMRDADLDSKTGLPENPNRKIWVNGQTIEGCDDVQLFRTSVAAVAIRGGYSELGSSIHHARIYRIEGSKPKYAMLRVFQEDLRRSQRENLFKVELPARSISVRMADQSLKGALSEGTATYLGWIVAGDEIEVDMSKFRTGIVGEFLTSFPMSRRWRVVSFETSSLVGLKPLYFAKEGLREEETEAVRKVVDTKGWRIAVNRLFTDGHPTVVRRDALGRVRETTRSGLPVSLEFG